jgi:hypothetical protein
MTIRLKPGVKVRPQSPSALSKYEGYISDQTTVIPNHERVYFPDFDVTLTFGHDELDVQVEEGRAFTTYFTNDAELAYAQLGRVADSLPQADPGDENDWAFAGDETEEVEDFYDNYTLEVGDDWVREVNEHNNGFTADVYVDEDTSLDHLVSFDIFHVFNGSEDFNDHVGVLLTPDAAYELALKLFEAADRIEL